MNERSGICCRNPFAAADMEPVEEEAAVLALVLPVPATEAGDSFGGSLTTVAEEGPFDEEGTAGRERGSGDGGTGLSAAGRGGATASVAGVGK